MLLPFNEWLCETLLQHPHLHVQAVEPGNPETSYFCRCADCNKWFIVDKKGLAKILRTHDPKPE